MSSAPMPSSRRKERFSLAYINAVAARAGFDLFETRVDIDGVDGGLRSAMGRRPQIDFQAKASSQDLLRDEAVVFPLQVSAYNQLRAETLIPRILIVVLMPHEETDWMSLSETELVMRRCGYWATLRGAPATENTTSINVPLPRLQIFDDQQLLSLMSKAEVGPML